MEGPCEHVAAVQLDGRPRKRRLVRVPPFDVLHLHTLKDKLDVMLAREGRGELAAACFRFLPDRARLDLAGWAAEDIFAHS